MPAKTQTTKNQYGERMTITLTGKTISVTHDDFPDSELRRIGGAVFLQRNEPEEAPDATPEMAKMYGISLEELASVRDAKVSAIVLGPDECEVICRFLESHGIEANDIPEIPGVSSQVGAKYFGSNPFSVSCAIVPQKGGKYVGLATLLSRGRRRDP